MLFEKHRVVIRGGGDLGSGVAYRLFLSGFPVLITELPAPLLLRRAVCFGSAAITGSITVEGVRAERVETIPETLAVQSRGMIPVLIDPDGHQLAAYGPAILVDARMRKMDPGLLPAHIPLVVGLGPGFSAPENCNAVIETNRGHRLGRVIKRGSAEGDTRQPGEIMGRASDRVIRAPVAGEVVGMVAIGAQVAEAQLIARVNEIPVYAPFGGVVRGLVHDGIAVSAGLKIADIDPRADPSNAFTISDKSLAVAGGVLEAILSGYTVWSGASLE
jgi:xanthine dehydrogenase accessory factor